MGTLVVAGGVIPFQHLKLLLRLLCSLDPTHEQVAFNPLRLDLEQRLDLCVFMQKRLGIRLVKLRLLRLVLPFLLAETLGFLTFDSHGGFGTCLGQSQLSS
jgi:hypothetical protein